MALQRYNGPVEYPYIVKTPGTCGGAPRLDGHRIRVSHIAACSEKAGWSPEEIAQNFSLTLAEVHAALTYYFDHLEEIRAEWREAARRGEEIKKLFPPRLPQIA